MTIRRTRLLLIDDHAILRESLGLLLRSQPDMQVVGEAGDIDAALRLASAVEPEVVLTDVNMPGGSGIKLTEQLRRAGGPRVIVLTMHEDPSYVRAALSAGCQGYVLKSSSPAVLLAAIRAVAAGRPYMDAALPGEADAPTSRDQPPPAATLSARERQTLELLAQGKSYAEIAEAMLVSVKTVEAFRTRLGKKLGFQSRADLVRYALEAGLLGQQPPPPEG